MSAWRLLPLAFLVVPVVEIAVIVQVGQLIGFWPTLALLLVESALGAWLVKREGLRAWQALRQAIRTGHLPSRELTDAALVLVGGTLLLTPGFLTDVAGFACVLPPSRAMIRRLLHAYLLRRARSSGSESRYGRTRPPPRSGPVVPGEVVEPPD